MSQSVLVVNVISILIQNTFLHPLCSYSTFSYTRDRDRRGTGTLVTLKTTVSLIPGVSPDTGVMVKEEPLEDDPLKADLLVKIKEDPDKPEMVQPSSAATGMGEQNHFTRSNV